MARRRSNKRKSSPRSTGRPIRKCRLNPKNPPVKVWRNKKVVNTRQHRDISYEGNVLKVQVTYNTPRSDEIILVEDNDVPKTSLSNNNELDSSVKKSEENISYARLPDYTERIVAYKPGDDLNISVTRNIININELNERHHTFETPLPENTLKIESDDRQNISEHINSNKTKETLLLDHITIHDDSDSEKSKENVFQNNEGYNIFDMPTLRMNRTLNDVYQTIDVAESDSESDDVIVVNDVTCVSTKLRSKRKKKRKKSVIVIDDDSVMEVSTTPTHTNKKFKNNNKNVSSKLLLPSPIVNNKNFQSKMDEFTPQVTSTPAKNNEEPSLLNFMGSTPNIQMAQPLPSSSVPIRITTNVNIPSYLQNQPMMGTLRNQALQIQKQISGTTTTTVGWNFLNANDVRLKGLRPIFIDGSNVAMGHVNGKYFSVKGLRICIDYFKMRGHEVTAIVPNYRKERSQNSDPRLLDKLENEGRIIFTPSRKVYGKTIVPYDDRYIVLLAHVNQGIIVSADNYRDLLQENPDWLDTIKNRILTPTWLKDMIIFPTDPLGRHGPTLDEFLRFPD